MAEAKDIDDSLDFLRFFEKYTENSDLGTLIQEKISPDKKRLELSGSKLNEKDFKELSNHKNKPCVSIFIPTQRAGKEVLEEKNKKHLHSEWTQVKKKLKEKEISSDEDKRVQEEIHKLTDVNIKNVDSFLAVKEQEIMTV